MSTREMAIDLISSLPEEQVKSLVDFIKGFVDSGTKKKVEETDPAALKKRKKREAYEHLRRLVDESAPLFADAEDNDKESFAKYLEERYGV